MCVGPAGGEGGCRHLGMGRRGGGGGVYSKAFVQVPICNVRCYMQFLIMSHLSCHHLSPGAQYKPIRSTRFVIAGTIEERILKLQEKKQAVFEGTVGRDGEALGKLTEDDLRFLFG